MGAHSIGAAAETACIAAQVCSCCPPTYLGMNHVIFQGGVVFSVRVLVHTLHGRSAQGPWAEEEGRGQEYAFSFHEHQPEFCLCGEDAPGQARDDDERAREEMRVSIPQALVCMRKLVRRPHGTSRRIFALGVISISACTRTHPCKLWMEVLRYVARVFEVFRVAGCRVVGGPYAICGVRSSASLQSDNM